MTDQLAITVPDVVPEPRPVVIPPNAPRCWVVQDDPPQDDWGYPDDCHFQTEAEAAKVVARLNSPAFKVVRLPFVCVEALCVACRYQLTASDYYGVCHFPSWKEAERVAECDGWKIGPRGEFICPACTPSASPAEETSR